MGDAIHTLVVGGTGCGKSRLMRERIIPGWRARGYAVLVCDPVCQDWISSGATWQTDQPLRFLAAAKASQRCVLVVDECDEMIRGDGALERAMKYLGTRSRNDGHRAYFIGQRAMQVPPSLRNNCGRVIAFEQPIEDAECLVRLINQPVLRECPTLPQGTAIMAEKWQKPVKIAVYDPATMRPI